MHAFPSILALACYRAVAFVPLIVLFNAFAIGAHGQLPLQTHPSEWDSRNWQFHPNFDNLADGAAWQQDWQEQLDPARQPLTASTLVRRNSAPESTAHEDSGAILRYKKGFFQRLSFSADWIDPSGDSGLEVIHLKASASVAVPLGSFKNLLIVTPKFEVDLIDAAPQVDVPDTLYDAALDFMWRKQLSDRWGMMIAVSPGYSSDFRTSDHAFRIRGFGFATWQWFPERLTLLFGVVYLDRNDLPMLPGVGLTWTPSADWRLDLLFPRPKLAYRLEFIPASHETWVYLSGQMGGRTWAVQRAGGVADELTLRDYRLALGWEFVANGGGGVFAEIGWSFGRQLQYEVIPSETSFGDAAFLRGGISF